MTLITFSDYRLGGIPRYYIAEKEDTMLIPDEVRKCVVFLLYKDKHQRFQFAGTAFWVSSQIEMFGFPHLITAKHVIVVIRQKGIDGKVYIRINDKQNDSRLIETQ